MVLDHMDQQDGKLVHKQVLLVGKQVCMVLVGMLVGILERMELVLGRKQVHTVVNKLVGKVVRKAAHNIPVHYHTSGHQNNRRRLVSSRTEKGTIQTFLLYFALMTPFVYEKA